MSTALTIRYIAYFLYLVSFFYAVFLTMPFIGGRRTTSDDSSSLGDGSLSELMSNINQWAESSDLYEDSIGHSRRVADLARQIGERYGLPPEELEALECAALLHDIGQINNFDFIREGRTLLVEEKIRLEEHSTLGEDLIKQIANIGPASLWVRWHHERWDGCGYPDQLSAEMIPLPVRILSVVDVFDALTHERPYRQALSPEDALKEMQKLAGTVFDPNVIQVFMSIDSESDIGSNLEV